jgi:hypothetical protein
MTTSTFILLLVYSLFHQELQAAKKLIQHLEMPYLYLVQYIRNAAAVLKPAPA